MVDLEIGDIGHCEDLLYAFELEDILSQAHIVEIFMPVSVLVFGLVVTESGCNFSKFLYNIFYLLHES